MSRGSRVSREEGRHIFVILARDVRRAAKLVEAKGARWLYLGKDVSYRENVSRFLGEQNRFPLGDLLHEVAHQQKQPFLEFIAELGRYQRNKLHWWASYIAYKDPIASDLFLLWCYAIIFERICAEGRRGEERLVVLVENRWLYSYLWQRYKERGNSLSFPSGKSVRLESLKSIAKGIASRGYFLLRAGWRMWQLHRLAATHRVHRTRDDKRVVYIYSEVADRCFQKDGKFLDTNFGRLPGILSPTHYRLVYVTPPFLTPDLKKKCRDYTGFEFTFLDQYVTFPSLLRSVFAVLVVSCPSSVKRAFPFLTVLLQHEIVHEFPFFPRNILYYYAFKKWLKEITPGEATIIYPFENQPWEKLLCRATREVNGKLRLIGYQHSTVPELLLNYFLGKNESVNTPLPDTIVANGEYTLGLLENAGYGSVELKNGGALRYEYLHQRKTNNKDARKDKNSKTILVALSYSKALDEDMLRAIFAAFVGVQGITFVIKPHPWVPWESLEVELSPWPAHFRKTEQAMSEVLAQSELVIYSSSSVGLEALLGGIPVVRYLSEHILDLDPASSLLGDRVKTCSRSELKQVVLSVLNQGDNPSAQEQAFVARNLAQFFSPVNEPVWRELINRSEGPDD